MSSVLHKIRKVEVAGFTLTEVLVALAILAISMAGAYRVITMATQLRKTSHDQYVATVIANNRIERAKNILFDNLTDLRENGLNVDDEGSPLTSGRFRRSTSVDTSWDGDPLVTRITVSVVVPRILGQQDSDRATVEVSTLLTKYEEP